MIPLLNARFREYERKHIKSDPTFKECGAVSQKIMRNKK